MHQDIGIRANAAEPLYAALSNSTGTPVAVARGHADAPVTDVWTEWTVDLKAFADQGRNLADID